MLHTIAVQYPENPTKIVKKTYYDFMVQFHNFIPDASSKTHFIELSERYPVSSYLDNRESFMKYIYFIHNHFNEINNKSKQNYDIAWENYFKHYDQDTIKRQKRYILYKKLFYMTVFFSLVVIIFLLQK